MGEHNATRAEGRRCGGEKKIGRVKGSGETLNGINQKNWSEESTLFRDSEHHSLPKSPQRGTFSKNSESPLSSPRVSNREPLSPISMESPPGVRGEGLPLREDVGETCGQASSATLDCFGQSSALRAGSLDLF